MSRRVTDGVTNTHVARVVSAESLAQLPATGGASQQALRDDERVNAVVALTTQHLSRREREGVQPARAFRWK